jgi:hypothetical protein
MLVVLRRDAVKVSSVNESYATGTFERLRACEIDAQKRCASMSPGDSEDSGSSPLLDQYFKHTMLYDIRGSALHCPRGIRRSMWRNLK